MTHGERRQVTLVRAGKLISRVVKALNGAALELADEVTPRKDENTRALMRLADDCETMVTETHYAALGDGCVVHMDGEANEYELERDGVTLVLPMETPDSLVDVLFGMAAALGVKPSRYTMTGLQAIVCGAIHEANSA